MLGTTVNTAAVIIGSLLGVFLRKGLPQKLRDALTQGMALCVIVIGIQGALGTSNTMLMILSIVSGGIIGSLIDIEARLDTLGQWLQKRFSKGNDDQFGKAFVTASLLFCVGAMAIVGSMDAGLRGDYATLFAKSILDGVTSIIMASTLGIGVIASAASVFIYQGAITLLAQVVSPILTTTAITEMSAVGGLLIIGVGLNMMRKEHIPVGNLLPAIFMPLVLMLVM